MPRHIFVAAFASASLLACSDRLTLPSAQQQGAPQHLQQAAIGDDGTFSVASVKVLNQYAVLAANATKGATSILVTNEPDLDSADFGPLKSGSLLMIMQMQGASMDTTDTVNYGSVDAGSAGLHELIVVGSIAGNTITLANTCGGLQNGYTAAAHTQVIRVPQFTSLTVTNTGTITAPPWDGGTGGIIALHVRDTMTLSGSVDVSGLGFRGGQTDNFSQAIGTDVPGYRGTTADFGAEKGESIVGASDIYDLLGGRYGRGAPSNGGGGGNSHNAGGGGGANAFTAGVWTGQGVMDINAINASSAWPKDPGYIANGNAYTTSPGGGRGGYSTSLSNQNATALAPGQAAWLGNLRRERGGLGGRPLTPDPLIRLFFGGGGGAGDGDNAAAGAGGPGGGIIYVLADTISGPGAFVANGKNGFDTVAPHNDAPGGAGAGGTIMLRVNAVSGFSMSANGGTGGNQNIGSGSDEAQGPGGGGGGGFIAVTSLAGAPTRSAVSGADGLTSSNGLTEFPVNGATRGGIGNGAAAVTDTPLCLEPADLVITKTDGVTTATPGTAVTYTILVTNNGPGIATRARVVDNYPGTLSSPSWTCTPTAGATCAAPSGTGNINAFVTMPVGSTVTYSATATISASATGTLSNTATIFSPPIINDPNLSNNVATDSDTLAPTADLSIVLTDSPDPVDERATLTYTLAVQNAGPSTATALSVSFPLPTGVTYVSAAGSGWACSQSAGTVTCTRASLAPGAAPNITVTVTAPVAPMGTSLSATATVTSAVTDPVSTNNSSQQTTTVNAVNDPPVNVVPGPQTSPEDTPLVFSLSLRNQIGVSDPVAAPGEVQVTLTVPSGVLTLGATSGLSSVMGNGTATVVFQGQLGAINSALNGLTFTPAQYFTGTLNLNISTNDLGNTGSGGPKTTANNIALTFTPTEHPPTLQNDTATVAENSMNNVINVLANDSDYPDMGETLNITGVTQPMHGFVTGGGTSVSYTPTPFYSGTDSFTYTVTDSGGGIATASVTVTVTFVNSPPTAVNDTFSVPQDTMNNVLLVLANDSDFPDMGEMLSVSAVTQPTHGTTSIAANGVSVLYTPTPGYSGGRWLRILAERRLADLERDGHAHASGTRITRRRSTCRRRRRRLYKRRWCCRARSRTSSPSATSMRTEPSSSCS